MEDHLRGWTLNETYCIYSLNHLTRLDGTCKHESHYTTQQNELVRGLLKISFEKDKICETCQMGKQIKTSFKNRIFISTSRPLELLHMDLFRPSKTTSLGGKSYAFVIVDNFSRYTWALFLAHKNDVFHEFSKLCRKIQNEKGFTISCIRSDHGREFENVDFESFCDEHGIEHNFSAPRTP